MEINLILNNRRATTMLAKKIAGLLNKGDVVALYGNLGVGKTYFVTQLLKYLGSQDDVSSPSYVILNEYQADYPVYHYDLYRLMSVDDVLELGIEENFKLGLTLIEWPEIASPLLPESCWHIYLDYFEQNKRQVRIHNKFFQGEVFVK